MTTLQHTKSDDLIAQGKPGLEVDLTPFLGTWKNTKPNTGQIPRITMKKVDGGLVMQAFGACEPDPCDWGEAKCEVFTDGVGSPTANAFIASYSFDFADVEISSNVKLGVLVVQAYTRFRDGSDRHNYYTREFYGPID